MLGPLAAVAIATGLVAGAAPRLARAGLPAPAQGPLPEACQGSSGSFFFYAGVRLLESDRIPVCVAGRLTISFHGDRATGCAASGRCDVSGTDVWRPGAPGSLEIDTLVDHGRREFSATLSDGEFSPLTTTTKTVLPGGTATCRDRVADAGGGSRIPTRGGRMRIALDPGFDGILGSRCAGPLDSDIASATPAVMLPVRRAERGRLSIDLSGTRSFAARGFAGTVSSTVVITAGRAHRSRPRRSGAAVERTLVATYRVEAVRGRVVTRFRGGGPTPLCLRLAACGLRGTLTTRPGPAQGTLGLEAIAPARRPVRDLRAALGVSRTGDPRGVELVSFGSELGDESLSAALGPPPRTCRDHLGGAWLLTAGGHAGRLHVAAEPFSAATGQPLRTRCPGPTLRGRDFVAGSVSLRALRAPTFTVALRGRPFRDGPYRVDPRSTLRVTLHRIAVGPPPSAVSSVRATPGRRAPAASS